MISNTSNVQENESQHLLPHLGVFSCTFDCVLACERTLTRNMAWIQFKKRKLLHMESREPSKKCIVPLLARGANAGARDWLCVMHRMSDTVICYGGNQTITHLLSKWNRNNIIYEAHFYSDSRSQPASDSIANSNRGQQKVITVFSQLLIENAIDLYTFRFTRISVCKIGFASMKWCWPYSSILIKVSQLPTQCR